MHVITVYLPPAAHRCHGFQATEAKMADGEDTRLAWGCGFMARGDLVAARGLVPCRPYVPVNTGFGAFSMILPVLISRTQT